MVYHGNTFECMFASSSQRIAASNSSRHFQLQKPPKETRVVRIQGFEFINEIIKHSIPVGHGRSAGFSNIKWTQER